MSASPKVPPVGQQLCQGHYFAELVVVIMILWHPSSLCRGQTDTETACLGSQHLCIL